MNKNLDIVAKELFGKIRTQFPKIKIGDEESKVTDKPELARFFDFDFVQDGENLGRISISISNDDGLVVLYSNDLIKDQGDFVKKKFFNFLRELREFAKQKLMNFDTRDIAKSNLDKRDFKQLSNNIGEGKMTESKLYGTSMTSYQQLGDTKLIVKHSAPVNYESPTGRTQRINSIYIENIEGERFKYPFKHLNGARALAQHIAHGGTPYDNIGQHVIGLSEEMSKLRMFKHYVDRNPTISENIGSIRDKVSERIEEVKKQIFDLQSPSKYEMFAEQFEEKEEIQIPEDIMNDWVDRLTIRTFNEELKNVFPYIFRLVDESDIPVKELGIDEILETNTVDEYSSQYESNIDLPELETYETFINQLVGEGADIFSDNEEAQSAAIEKLNQLIAEPMPVGVDATNAVESLSDIIDDEELMDIFKELADVNPEADVRDILKDYIKMKDEESGTDVLSQLNFGEGEAGMDAAPEPEAPAEPAAEPAAEMPPEAPAEPAAEPAPVTASIEHSGSKMAEVIQKAVKAGMKLEDTFKVSGKQITLKDAIEKAGMKVEDFFGDKEKAITNELVEFVKSMFNAEEGSFPKGETGVLIAVEKKFGESAVPVAQKVIGKLHQISEMSRMKRLAGL